MSSSSASTPQRSNSPASTSSSAAASFLVGGTAPPDSGVDIAPSLHISARTAGAGVGRLDSRFQPYPASGDRPALIVVGRTRGRLLHGEADAARVVSSELEDLLVGERRSLLLHNRLFPRIGTVRPQSLLEIGPFLTRQLRYVDGRPLRTLRTVA